MRNFSWIIVLSQVLASLFAGCSSGGDSSDDDATSDDDADDAADDDGADDDTDDDTDDDADDDTWPPPPDDDAETGFESDYIPKDWEFAPPPSDSAGIFVSATTGSDENPGTAALPMGTIQAGVDKAFRQGKAVFVAQGDYDESVVSQVSLYGSYTTDFQERTLPHQSTTITGTEEFGVALEDPGFEDAITIEGFRVHGGGETPLFDQPWGLWARGRDVTVVIAHNVIDGGFASSSHGGVIIDGTETVRTVLVRNFISGVPLGQISDAGISDALGFYTSGYLAALAVNNVIATGVIRNGVGATAVNLGSGSHGYFFGNSLDGGSEGYLEYGSTAFEVMTASLWGGILAEGRLANNIINGGVGAEAAFGVVIDSLTAYTVNANDIWGLTTDWVFCRLYYPYDYTCRTTVEELNALWFAERNISQDPRFQNASAGDFSLMPDSPCIDAGQPPSMTAEDRVVFGFVDLRKVFGFDLAGNPRPYGDGWDIGPYEWRP